MPRPYALRRRCGYAKADPRLEGYEAHPNMPRRFNNKRKG